MGEQIKTKALVLHGMPIGDYDKRLVLLTKDKGKVIAFAKGSKKAKSKLLAGSEIFAYGDYLLFKGSQSYQVNHVDLITTFHNIRLDIDQLSYGLYVLEFVNYILEEENPNKDLMRLTLKTLKMIEKDNQDLLLIRSVFELKAMSLVGYSPWVSSCIKCNRTDELFSFSSQEGGVLCTNCQHHDHKALKICKGTRYAIHYILTTNIDKVFQFKVENTIKEELAQLSYRFIDYNLNKKFNSLQYLDLGKYS